jgi:1-acyl-sn-glycerol-3-phosphate acyltransferase
MRRFTRWLVRVIVDLVAVVKIHGYENIPKRGGFVVATNHLGFLDAPMAYYGLPELELFIPVAEKWRENPVLRWISHPLNLIFIDRFNPDLKAMREILRRMDQGQTLVIAPEGTRSRTEELAEGKAGVSFLAARYNLPILPVALSGTEDRIFLSNLKRFRKTHVTIHAGEVFRLPPLPRENRDQALREDTDEIMVRIAAMLPEKNRGHYANHPRLKEFLARA